MARIREKQVIDTKQIVSDVLKYTLLVIGAIVLFFPFLWMLTTALKTLSEAIATPPRWLPRELQWVNFAHVWQMKPFVRYIFNTLVCCLAHVVGGVVLAVLGAYAFSMYDFKFKGLFFTLFTLTMMVPGELLIIQNYITIQKMHLMDTYTAVYLPTLASGFYIYMLREHFMQMPPSLFKSAKVDGTSNWRFLWRVMVPMNRNTIFTIAILSFISQWNAFLWPELVTRTDATKLVSSGLIAFRVEASSNVQYMMAGSCIVLFPMILFYAVFNKQIINGVGGGGIKG